MFYSGMPKYCQRCNEFGHVPQECDDKWRRCSNCSEVGHEAKDCTKEKQCTLCSEKGHVYRDCPEKKLDFAEAARRGKLAEELREMELQEVRAREAHAREAKAKEAGERKARKEEARGEEAQEGEAQEGEAAIEIDLVENQGEVVPNGSQNNVPLTELTFGDDLAGLTGLSAFEKVEMEISQQQESGEEEFDLVERKNKKRRKKDTDHGSKSQDMTEDQSDAGLEGVNIRRKTMLHEERLSQTPDLSKYEKSSKEDVT